VPPIPAAPFTPWTLLCLGTALLVLGSLHGLLLWLGHRREPGLGPLLAAGTLQGLGLWALLAQAPPAAVTLALLAGAGLALWALRRYAGLPARMNRWAWLALGAWLLLTLALWAMGFRWVQQLVLPVTLAAVALGASRELGRLSREAGRPAQVASILAAALALAAVGAGLAGIYPGGCPPLARAWFALGLLTGQQALAVLLGQVQGQRLQARLAALAATDPLTGLASARGFRERLDRAVGRSLRTGRPCSLLVLEIDGFDALSREHGPAPAGRILQAFAHTLNQTLREADLSGRLDGCRFAALLHQTPPMEALLAAERLRGAWENLPLTLGAQALRATLSGGVASTREAVTGSADLLALALDRVASARQGGGNNVEGEALAT